MHHCCCVTTKIVSTAIRIEHTFTCRVFAKTLENFFCRLHFPSTNFALKCLQYKHEIILTILDHGLIVQTWICSSMESSSRMATSLVMLIFSWIFVRIRYLNMYSFYSSLVSSLSIYMMHPLYWHYIAIVLCASMKF